MRIPFVNYLAIGLTALLSLQFSSCGPKAVTVWDVLGPAVTKPLIVDDQSFRQLLFTDFWYQTLCKQYGECGKPIGQVVNPLVKAALRANEATISRYSNEFLVIPDPECPIDAWWIWESLLYITDDFTGIEFTSVEIFGADDTLYATLDDQARVKVEGFEYLQLRTIGEAPASGSTVTLSMSGFNTRTRKRVNISSEIKIRNNDQYTSSNKP